MKLLLVTLALTIFTGTQAFVLRDEPNVGLQRLEEELEMWVRGGFEEVMKKLSLIEASEAGQLIKAELDTIMERIHEFTRAVETDIPPQVSETYTMLLRLPEGVLDKAWNILKGTEPQLKSVAEELFQVVQFYTAQLPSRVVSYMESLRLHISARIEDLKAKQDEELTQDMQRLLPYARNLQSQLQAYMKYLEPIAEPLQELYRTVTVNGGQVLYLYLAPTVKAYQEHKEEFHQWAHSPVSPPKQ